MDLKARLRSLEAAAGRLPSMPREVHTANSSEADLADALGARMLSPGLLYREERLPAAYRHGGFCLGEVLDIGCEPLGVRIPASDQGWLFLDTETTGLAGGTGTLVFLFGAVALHDNAFVLRQWLLTRFSGEPALMHEIRQALAACGLIISFNGKSFDMPLIRTRYRMQGQTLDERHLTHLDLLHPARSAFAKRWPDVRLQTAERRLCAYQRDDDLPGSEAPAAFTRWLRHGEGDGLVRVMQHHRDDVLSLVTLCAALVRTFHDPVGQDADEAGILRRLQRRGYRLKAGQGRLALAD